MTIFSKTKLHAIKTKGVVEVQIRPILTFDYLETIGQIYATVATSPVIAEEGSGLAPGPDCP